MHIFQCLMDIFPLPDEVKLVVAFGDNDLGGEGRDIMSDETTK